LWYVRCGRCGTGSETKALRVPERLRDGLLAGGIAAENISVVLPEEDAVKAALDVARPGDLVVSLYMDHNRIWDLLTAACGKQNQGTKAC